MPDSGSSQSSLDLDAIKEKASIKVALPAKVRASRYTPLIFICPTGEANNHELTRLSKQVLHAFTIKSGSQLAKLGP